MRPAQGWQVAVAAGADPVYLQQPDILYRAQRLDALDALYVQLRSNLDEDGQQLEPFLRETLAQARAAPPHNLVLDLRFDVGGDISLSREFLRELVRATTGKIFVLISRYTFSAGIVSAAAVRHDGGSRVTLVGEPVGDRLRFWSEGGDVCMPNSHYCLRPTSGLWDLERGCKSVPGCYGDQFEATAGSLQPQLSAPLTAAAWLAGRDLAMEAVTSELRVAEAPGCRISGRSRAATPSGCTPATRAGGRGRNARPRPAAGVAPVAPGVPASPRRFRGRRSRRRRPG